MASFSPNPQTSIKFPNTHHIPSRYGYPPPLPPQHPLVLRNQHIFRHQRNVQLTQKTHPYCISFKRFGRCRYGASCIFAHINEDGTKVVPSGGGQNEMDAASATGVTNLRLCRWFYARIECPFGEKCVFAHEELERCVGEQHHGLRKSNTSTVCVADSRNASSSSEKACSKLAPKSLVDGKKTSVLPEDRIKADLKKQQKKWKQRRIGKISGIYADWIEGFLVPC